MACFRRARRVAGYDGNDREEEQRDDVFGIGDRESVEGRQEEEVVGEDAERQASREGSSPQVTALTKTAVRKTRATLVTPRTLMQAECHGERRRHCCGAPSIRPGLASRRRPRLPREATPSWPPLLILLRLLRDDVDDEPSACRSVAAVTDPRTNSIQCERRLLAITTWVKLFSRA